MIPRGVDHWSEFIAVARGEAKECGSNFDYASRLTEMVLLGTIAERVAAPLDWDGQNMRITNHEAADLMLRHQYRAGWTL